MDADQISAILLSLWVSSVGVLIGLPPGLACGWLLARKNFWGKTILETIVYLPLVLPPVVTGYLLLVAFGRNGTLGILLESLSGVSLVFDWKGAAVAAAVVSFPLMVRSIRLGISSVDPTLEMAAQTLGATPWDAFWTITVPLARSGIIAGCVLAFARGFGEFGATIMISGNIPGKTQTMPLYVYDQMETPGGLEDATIVIIVAILIAAASLMLSELLERRGRSGSSQEESS
ncbi:molybdate ABC transporter permease subunit [Blastopirellula marina]|uniref:Molybdenum transport system permease n=1 Tax=Blastopirellula marina TaxID=124 RepID=A0A2S8G9M1_9BACT|nr:molybdate ABC transporter permease subunit [Blastopirellula marina]PQO41133.1 molybdate ABC transporter permease subunit [Blastopirellula marina]PTL46009.1 molybdate ABC transporter permease [Blastopirellula marina]